MAMADTMICAFLLAQLSSICLLLFAIDRLRCRAPGGPWGKRFQEACRSGACCGHSTLPVVRPEEVEACQCEGGIDNIDLGQLLLVKYKLRATEPKQGTLIMGAWEGAMGGSRAKQTRSSRGVQSCLRSFDKVLNSISFASNLSYK